VIHVKHISHESNKCSEGVSDLRNCAGIHDHSTGSTFNLLLLEPCTSTQATVAGIDNHLFFADTDMVYWV
jgi:hypothetical protein